MHIFEASKAFFKGFFYFWFILFSTKKDYCWNISQFLNFCTSCSTVKIRRNIWDFFTHNFCGMCKDLRHMHKLLYTVDILCRVSTDIREICPKLCVYTKFKTRKLSEILVFSAVRYLIGLYSAGSLVLPALLTPTLVTPVVKLGFISFRTSVKWAEWK